MQGEDLKVFFSYARADSAFALRLAEDMRSAGVALWIDQLDIPTGARWDQAVEDALKACPRLLIILSPASVASQNVMDEVAFAIDENKKILPVLYQHCEVPFRLRRLQYIQFTDEYDKAFPKLLTACAADPPDNGRARLSMKTHVLQRMATKRMALILVIISVCGTVGWALMANSGKVWRWSTQSPEWMTAQQYQETFDKQVQDGFYPHKVEGRCASGREQFHVEWKGFPLGSEGFIAHHAATREFYEQKNQEYISMGFSLESLNSFKDCEGNNLYQANWFKRKPIP